MKNLRIKIGAVALAAVSVFGGMQLASADVPAADGTITGCQNDITGLIRLVDAEALEVCGIGETEVTWTDEGVDGYEVVSDTSSFLSNYNYHAMVAYCPAGKVAVGGGGRPDASNSTYDNDILINARVYASHPVTDVTYGSGWRFEAFLSTPNVDRAVIAYAICVDE